MELYPLLKLVHIVCAGLLFGTGLGTAWFLWWTYRSGDLPALATAARLAVLADWVFTAPAVILQPLTGFGMAYLAGYPLRQSWLTLSLFLYVLIGACWLPVVWLQIRVRELAVAARRDGAQPPARFHSYMKLWFALGWPAFLAVLATFYLMVYKPALW